MNQCLACFGTATLKGNGAYCSECLGRAKRQLGAPSGMSVAVADQIAKPRVPIRTLIEPAAAVATSTREITFTATRIPDEHGVVWDLGVEERGTSNFYWWANPRAMLARPLFAEKGPLFHGTATSRSIAQDAVSQLLTKPLNSLIVTWRCRDNYYYSATLPNGVSLLVRDYMSIAKTSEWGEVVQKAVLEDNYRGAIPARGYLWSVERIDSVHGGRLTLEDGWALSARSGMIACIASLYTKGST